MSHQERNLLKLAKEYSRIYSLLYARHNGEEEDLFVVEHKPSLL